MMISLILGLAVILLCALLYAEDQELLKPRLFFKTLLSCLFVLTLAIQSGRDPLFYRYMMVGMVLCLGGDVFLAVGSERTFMLGLISFLLGHVFYVFGFLHLTGLAALISIDTLVVFAVSAVVYKVLKPHLGSMSGPVLAYVLVISIMLSGAFAVMELPLRHVGKTFLCAGAILFYLSDLFVARDRFVKKESLNRFAGLPLYYGGQFFIAFSVGML